MRHLWLMILCICSIGLPGATETEKPKLPEYEPVKPANILHIVARFTRQKVDLAPYRAWLVEKVEGNYLAISEQTKADQDKLIDFLVVVKFNHYRIQQLTRFKLGRYHSGKITFVVNYRKVGATADSVFSLDVIPKPKPRANDTV